MKRILKVVTVSAVVIVILFTLLAPVIPTTISLADATAIRDQCGGLVGQNSPQFQVWTSASYFLSQDFGAAYVPKGVPFSSDGSGYYFILFGYPPISCG